MSFSPEQGFEDIRKALDGDAEVIAHAEVENLKNSALEAGAQLTANPYEKDPQSISKVIITHTGKPKTPEAPAKHWLADWEDAQEEQNDQRHERSDHDADK